MPSIRLTSLALVTALLLGYAVFGSYFAREVVIEIALLAILALSLELVAGHGGMVSLCHGALYGCGAYIFAGLTVLVALPSSLAALLAVLGTAGCGWLVGLAAGGTAGIYFIMATLAFGQMGYVLVFQSELLGGDDGISGVPRFDLTVLGVDFSHSLTFALLCISLMLCCYAAITALLNSSFGRTLSGIHSNAQRMRALGLEVRRHKAIAFAISAAFAGSAGVLGAQHIQFVSPDLLFWTLSGEILIVVILGGMGTVVGPVVGAAVLVALKHEVSRHTDYWHLVIGAFLIAAVLLGGRGLYGELERHPLLARWRAKGTGHA